jgi:DNA-binding CsgD family transcriptional regulator/tetratricopeptide (TPR) repeat protein
VADAIDELERGRRAYRNQSWKTAHGALVRAEAVSPLSGEDLELLATAASMLGAIDEQVQALERAYHRYLENGDDQDALRCAVWLGIHLMLAGSVGRASGWLSRAERQLEQSEDDSAGRGYLLLPIALRKEAAGDLDGAIEAAREATEIGESLRDADLAAIARQATGNLLIVQGRSEEGLGLLDEAMVAVIAGELSPVPTGLVYCGAIEGCHEAYELRRAREWTEALTEWCEKQPEMVAFTGRCLVHRAEIMQLEGAWDEALDEAERAHGRAGMSGSGVALAHYRRGDLLRLRGEFAAAEAAYREASRLGHEPQPGLAWLRLAQRNAKAAAATIRRAVAEATEPSRRVALLPAHVEIMLAVDAIEDARRGCSELEELAGGYESGMVGALAAHARGATELGDGNPRAALGPLRRAVEAWRDLGAPYEAARSRVLVALGCQALGDGDAADMELDAARTVFAELGAEPDLERVSRPGAAGRAGLTARELEVLRLVAAGNTNRAIAGELVLSERTVDRHVSNIYAKLDVSSRAAATAYAYEHGLI